MGIYQPAGAAREYSPFALNHIKGCDHGCVYCYVPKIMKRFNSDYVHANVGAIREEDTYLTELEKNFKKHAAESGSQVFLSFLTDPYCDYEKENQITRHVLELLLKYKIPVSVLSKGGYNMIRDIDLFAAFGSNIQVGASLTFMEDLASRKWESGAALPGERLKALEMVHDAGVRTWASMEPVVFPDQTMALIRSSYMFVDGYKIGKLNHHPNYESKVDWSVFLSDAVNAMRKYKKTFYIKKDLLEYKLPNVKLVPHETDMDFMAIKKWI